MSIRTPLKLVAGLLLVFTAVLLLTNVHAQPQADAYFQRLDPERFVPLPHLDIGVQHNNQTSPEQPAMVSSWARVAYQSYRDGNWEIYTGKDDGTDQIRLTYHPATDIHPRYNRGNTRVVFASNRDGDYEIFVINADGTGLTQLTFNTTDDVNPTWSNDGTQIAFQAYQNGQAELYKMNADGSGQTRLTANEAYDGMPAWSPDDQKIAFVSSRTGGYRIHTINAEDGSGVLQISNQPNSFNPTWSPNGMEMAFDADADGDGWQELWRMNADGSNQRAVYDPPGQTDAWARSWHPGGYLIALTTISFIQYQGDWYWTEAYIAYAENGANPLYDRLSSEDTNWLPDWQTSDNQPPTTQFLHAPLYIQQDGEDYSASDAACWTASDTGGAELMRTEIEYRQGNEPWSFFEFTYKFSCTSFRPIRIGDDRFGWFDVRARSTDNAYNNEVWPTTPDARILIYEWRLHSTVKDVRSNPLENVEIVSDHILYAVPNEAASERATYFEEPRETAVGWTKTGFMNLPATDYTHSFMVATDTDIFMPAADNIIVDWGFENDDLSLAWVVDGTHSNPDTTYHTGSQGVFFDANLRAISQSMTVPTNMTNPTLSFLYGSAWTIPSHLEVIITDGISETQTVYPITAPVGWLHSWLDMSEWQGKTITVTFGSQTADDTIFLDEVTLASAHPDVWVNMTAPPAALPGTQIIYEIDWSNNTNLNAYSNTVTLTLPSEVNFITASIPPTIMGDTFVWDVGDLLAGNSSSLLVTATVDVAAPLLKTASAQVIIQSMTPELELANNMAVHSMFIGSRAYLPVVLKH